jgi:hypothetical protein
MWQLFSVTKVDSAKVKPPSCVMATSDKWPYRAHLQEDGCCPAGLSEARHINPALLPVHFVKHRGGLSPGVSHLLRQELLLPSGSAPCGSANMVVTSSNLLELPSTVADIVNCYVAFLYGQHMHCNPLNEADRLQEITVVGEHVRRALHAQAALGIEAVMTDMKVYLAEVQQRNQLRLIDGLKSRDEEADQKAIMERETQAVSPIPDTQFEPVTLCGNLTPGITSKDLFLEQQERDAYDMLTTMNEFQRSEIQHSTPPAYHDHYGLLLSYELPSDGNGVHDHSTHSNDRSTAFRGTRAKRKWSLCGCEFEDCGCGSTCVKLGGCHICCPRRTVHGDAVMLKMVDTYNKSTRASPRKIE